MKEGILSTTFTAHTVFYLVPPGYSLRDSYHHILQMSKLGLRELQRSATTLHTASATRGCSAFTVPFTAGWRPPEDKGQDGGLLSMPRS